MSSATQSWREAVSNVTYALSLTAIMAVALFVTVGINPKAESYGNMPWYYAGVSLLASGLLYVVSRRSDRSRQVEEPLQGPNGK